MYHYNPDPCKRLDAFAANIGLPLSSPEATGVGANTVSPKGYIVHKTLQARRLLRLLRIHYSMRKPHIGICESILANLEAKAEEALAEYGVDAMDFDVNWERRRERSLS